MKKTLYFEGAGWSGAEISKATVGNCRIRTAFHLDDGRAVYLEMMGTEVTKHTSPSMAVYAPYAGYVDYCHYITEDTDNDDANKHRIICRDYFPYTKEGILKVVNGLGASFDEIAVVPDLGGYRVFHEKHGSKGFTGAAGYNFGDVFQYDQELTAKREAIHDAIYAIEKAEWEDDKAKRGKKFVHSPGVGCYPNFSLWVDEEDKKKLHLLRHFNGYNKHWEIDATKDDWNKAMLETELGRYGC